MPSAVQQRPRALRDPHTGPESPTGSWVIHGFHLMAAWGPRLSVFFFFLSSLSSSLRAVAGPVLRSTPGVPGASVAFGAPGPGLRGPGPWWFWLGRSGVPTLCGSLGLPSARWGSWPAGRRRSLLNRSSFFTCQGPLAVLRGGSVCVISCGLLFCCAMWALVAVFLFWKLLRVGNFRPSSCGSELRGAEPVVR